MLSNLNPWEQIFLIWRRSTQKALLQPKGEWSSQGKVALRCVCDLNSSHLERMIDRQTAYSDLSIGHKFSWKWSKWAWDFKDNDWLYIVASDKIWAFKEKLEILETCCKLDSFPKCKDFADEISGVAEDWIGRKEEYNEVYQHKDGFDNSPSQCFPNNQYAMNHTRVKDPFKVQKRSVDFNATESRIHW